MKRVSGLIAFLLVCCLVFVGCGSDSGGVDKENKKIKIAFVSSAAGANDTGYNKSAVDALKKVAPEINAEYKVVEPTNGVPQALETLAEEGYNLIFSLEYDFEALINGVGGVDALAKQYPETKFVIFNANPNVTKEGKVKHKNVYSVLFDVHEASFLSGYAYVLMNEAQDKLFGDNYKLTPLAKKRAASFVGGTNSEGILVYSYGFIEGIQRAAKEMNVTYDYYAKYDAGFSDPAIGSTVAGTFFDNGANVVFADCGMVGDGITSKAKSSGNIAIQVDADLDNTQPGHILTSVLKITGVPLAKISKAYADGSLDKMDNLQTYNLASGATGITDMSVIGKHVKDQSTWKSIQEKVKVVAEEIKSGKQKVVNAQNGEKLDFSTVPNVKVQ